ncbi:MAG: aminotransferase class I/II-fold pyridoxal phosphate-dependent enzyme [Hymenobacter sp.]
MPTRTASATPAHAVQPLPRPGAAGREGRAGPIKGVGANQIFLGNGSDEAIDLLVRLTCTPGGADSILLLPPTYGMYEVAANLNDVRVERLPLTADFQLSPDLVAGVAGLASQAGVSVLAQ